MTEKTDGFGIHTELLRNFENIHKRKCISGQNSDKNH